MSTQSDPDWNISIFDSGAISLGIPDDIRLSQHTFRTSEASSVLMMLGGMNVSPAPYLNVTITLWTSLF